MKLGIIMDPIEKISVAKDSSFAMLLAAQKLGWDCYYMQLGDLQIHENRACALMRPVSVKDNPTDWFKLGNTVENPLKALDIILMRKDPPVDMQYIYATQILELAEAEGVKVINRPAALRNVNEKLFIHWFPDCVPPTLITRDQDAILQFLEQYKTIVVKPLDGMGGISIFQLNTGDVNNRVIIETLIDSGKRFVIAQKFIPDIVDGDKRILLINGEPVPYALARIPRAGEIRGNLAAGGSGRGVELTENDYRICKTIGPRLRNEGLFFVGIDVIGDNLTEINVTSPTCIRELDKLYNLDIAGQLLQRIIETR